MAMNVRWKIKMLLEIESQTYFDFIEFIVFTSFQDEIDISQYILSCTLTYQCHSTSSEVSRDTGETNETVM